METSITIKIVCKDKDTGRSHTQTQQYKFGGDLGEAETVVKKLEIDIAEHNNKNQLPLK